MTLGLTKKQIPILIIALLAVLGYAAVFSKSGNTEFLIYIGVVVFFLALILFTHTKVNYTNGLLAGLTLWAVLHLSGGGLHIQGTRLYDLILLPLNEKYEILKYDQMTHFVGFYVATLVMHHILKPHLKSSVLTFAPALVIVMAGTGLGALNEVVEFGASIAAERSGVGGYVNTALDLVFNLMGAVAALVYLKIKKA